MIILSVMFVTIISTDGIVITNNRLTTQMIPQLEEIAHIEDTGGDTFSSMADSDILIVMDMYGGLRFYNISDPSNPTYMSYYNDGGIPHDMFKVGDLLYLADHYHGLEIYNISNPSNTIKLGSIVDSGDGEMDGVFVNDDLAYVAEWHDSTWDWSMKIINVTDPTDPTEVTEYTDDDNEFVRFFVREGICFTACLQSGFKILNVTDPLNISEISHFDDLYYTMEFQMINDLVFIADGLGLQILNVSIPNSPVRIGNYSTADHPSVNIKVVNDIAYLAAYEIGLQILNVSDPENIVMLNEFAAEMLIDVEVQNDLIFLSMHEYGLKILRETWVEGSANLSLPIISLVGILPMLFLFRKKRRKK